MTALMDLPELEADGLERELIQTSEGETLDPTLTAPESLAEMLPPLESQERLLSPPPRKRRNRAVRVSVEDAETSQKRQTRRGKGQPSADEWSDFFAEYALEWLMEAYIWICFLGVDRDQLPREFWDDLACDEEDVKSIADALASFTHGTEFSRKYGRKITSSAAILDASHALIMWGIQIQRAATKVKRAQGVPTGRQHRNRSTKNVYREGTSSEAQRAEGGDVREYTGPIRIVNPGGA
jgi:hypothetical protein